MCTILGYGLPEREAFRILSFYKRISFKSGETVMHNKKPSELFVLKVFVVAEWKGFEPLRGYKPT